MIDTISLYGRASEQARLERMLTEVRRGRSGALVVRGEAGVGKTALLERIGADAGATGLRVLRGVGIESEAELPFAGLHRLLYPFFDRLDALPGPQTVALRVAFGLEAAPATDRFLIGAATLSLLSELSGDGLLCLLDDAQWLDQASSEALLFAARRLYADPVAMVFGVREGEEPFPAAGIEELRLGGLDPESASALLTARAPGLAEPLRNRILAEAGGNPLALIELASSLNAPELAWWEPSPLPVGTLAATARAQEAFQAKVDELPAPTRLALLVAAADGTARLGVVLRAGEQLGLRPADLEPAERARLIRISGDAVAFRHPLVRAVVYQGAAHGDRTAVHEALAQALAAEGDADRRAWHLAAAATGVDDRVADNLDHVAGRAERRGGSLAVAVALARSAELTTDPARKAERLVRAARAAYDAGRAERATELARQAALLGDEPSVEAEAGWIRAQVAYERSSPATAAALALEAATPVAGSDPERAVPILTEAIWCARDAGEHALVARSVELLVPMPRSLAGDRRTVVDGLVGFGHLLSGATPEAVGPMRAMAEAARHGRVDGFVERVIAGFMGLLVAHDEVAIESLEHLVADLRGQGAVGWLPYAQEPLALAQLLSGRFRDAESNASEALSLAQDIGQGMQVVVVKAILAWLAAVQGDDQRCPQLADDVLADAARHPTNAALAGWGLGLLDLAAGRWDAALERLEPVCSGPARRDLHIRAVPDLVEAAVRSGRADVATRHLPAFDDWAGETGRPLAAALSRRCHALVAAAAAADGAGDGDGVGGAGDAHTAVEDHHATAVQLHRDDLRPYDLARTQLVHGEWLRRHRRRTAARAELVAAQETFERLGARAWAARARAELEALGERPVARPHDTDLVARLTPQESQVVRLAAAGMSNKEIGARLFLSPRTVGHHLYKAYPKLGVTKRIQLTQLDLEL